MSDSISVFGTVPRIVMGPGSVAGLGQEVRGLGSAKCLIVTDPGIIAAGLLKPVEASLEAAKIVFQVFSQVTPDPRYETVDACLASMEGFEPSCVVGLGGGSPLDIAKTAAVMLTNPGVVSDYFGIDMVPNAGVPSIMIPSTAGTGSEVTPIAILSDEAEKLKMGVVSPYLFPKVALLDPCLTLGLPSGVTASTGMDALIHAIEAYTSVKATAFTDLLAARAVELISGNLRTAFARGGDISARAAMLEGSLLAGMAFANAGVTAVHAFAYPIGAGFHIPHGVANTLMLPAVMKFNLVGNLARFADLAAMMGRDLTGLSLREAAWVAVDEVTLLAQDLRVPSGLGGFGIREEHLLELSQGVMKSTRLLENNCRAITAQDAEDIYRQAL